MRAVCLISREYPPETAFGGIARVVEMQARQLVAAGVAVHVISLDPGGRAGTFLQDGVVVHRVTPPPMSVMADMSYVELGAWSQVVADTYRQLDEKVHFDVVHAQDYFAETLHLVRRPDTPLLIQLHSPSALIHDRATRTPGQQAADALELVALRGADALVAPTQRIADDVVALVGAGAPPTVVLAPPFDAARFAVAPIPHPGTPLRLLFVGRLEYNKGPDLALWALAEVRARGVAAALTLVGRDIDAYRRRVLRPLMDELGLDSGDVRFVEQLDEAGVIRHLRAADVVIVPSRRENLHTAAVEAIAAGVPVICGDVTGLTDWLGPDDGVVALPTDDTFAARAADVLCAPTLPRANAARVAEIFDPTAATAAYLATCARLCGPSPTKPAHGSSTPAELAIVVLAHNALNFTQRAVRSILEHTVTPFDLIVVDNASSDGTADWFATLDDPRVTFVHSDVNLGVSGGRNAGLDHVPASARYIAFLDNDVEVLSGWDVDFVAALDADETAAIAGELGVNLAWTAGGRSEEPLIGRPGPLPTDMAVGFCMVMRADAVRLIGRFDEGLGLFWHDDDDFAIRAKRLGYGVLHIGGGRVLHFEHRSSVTVAGLWDAPEVPSEMSSANQAFLAAKWERQLDGGIPGSRAFSVLAFADELAATPELLAEYCARFSERDDATLVVYAPDTDSAALEQQLLGAFAAAGVDADAIPDVMALNPSDMTPDDETALAQQVDAVLSERAPDAVFGAPPRAGVATIGVLSAVAQRIWSQKISLIPQIAG
ncbi:MAG TPA: glycosyltransferase [Acidimicrobiales bacterium]|nr:glycosyltransferase [Acidimicrobiales bacterium]